MKAEIIPLLVVNDVLANVECLEHTLGFRLDRASDEEGLAVMKYLGATVMIQSRKAYAASQGASPEKYVPADGIEFLIRVDNIDGAYEQANKNNAKVTRHLHNVAETFESSIRRFSIALPDGHIITLFAYISNTQKSA